MGAYKFEQRQTSLTAAIGDAYSELQSLRDEMREWADNLENGNLGHTDRGQRVAEAADALDNVADDEPEMELGEFDPQITYAEQINRRKGKPASRSVRCSNASSMLGAVIEALETEMEKLEEGEDDVDLKEEAEGDDKDDPKEKLEELRDHLQNTVDEIDGIEFPGMYG